MNVLKKVMAWISISFSLWLILITPALVGGSGGHSSSKEAALVGELNSISLRFSNDPFSSFCIIQMANTNDTSIPVSILPPYTTIISIKLDGSHNYLAWKMQFLNLLRGHDLMGFIDGTEACPPKHIASGSLNLAYVVWQKKDVCLLGWILASLSEKLVSTIYGLETSKQVWTALQTRFSSQSHQLAAAGKPIDDQDLISFLLGGLQSSYTPFVTSFNFASRETDFTFEDFQAEFLGYENLLDVNHSVHNTDGPHFAFAANKSKAPTYVQKKGPPLPPTKMQNAASSNYRSQQTRSTPPQLPNNRPVCQICGKSGHTAIDCFHRFDYSYQGRFPLQDLAAMVAETNATFDHQVWYMDSGANAHITSYATNLTHQQPFRESETVTVGNGSGRILLQGVVENDLYPLAGCKTFDKSLTCLSTTIGVRANADTWHSRLGHPSSVIFNSLFHSNKLSVKGSSTKLEFCLACQLGKAKQLPFPESSRQSSVPLTLIHSDVWVSPVQSTGDIVIPPISHSPQVLPEADNISNNPIVQPTFTQIQTRFKTGHSQPKSFPDYTLYYHTRHPLQAFSAVLDTPEPTSYTQAVSDPQWRAAMGREFDALMEMGLSLYVLAHLINTLSGTNGYTKLRRDQMAVLNVLRLDSWPKVHFHWPIQQLDVSNAFLHGFLDEEVFMEQPRGVEVDRSSQGLHLCQTKYICDLLDQTHMAGAKPLASLTVASTKLSSTNGELLSDPSTYRHIIGALQYYTITHPDISYAVNQLCQYMHQPRTPHWQAMKRVLRYLKGSVNHGLFYTPSPLQLHTYCDSDWAGNPDDRRYTSGYGVFLGRNLVSWSSKKQHVVSRSSTKAEYRSMALATAEVY
ncbi:Retrovirus-related Pol polyprotein from transposon RE2 [Vitis vinifera]|uniref:Retrovirus-related Pol polyprotein from transposon RE2 n=1 Tax=Vitis vinifera TaxID=29760 RepID=A0A438I8Y4_VITVI|nr:Retrovirus-related Pol polyprotein from transposon RE2 [Vitis vinifera]